MMKPSDELLWCYVYETIKSQLLFLIILHRHACNAAHFVMRVVIYRRRCGGPIVTKLDKYIAAIRYSRTNVNRYRTFLYNSNRRIFMYILTVVRDSFNG